MQTVSRVAREKIFDITQKGKFPTNYFNYFNFDLVQKLLQVRNLDCDLFEFFNKGTVKTFSNSERYDQDSLICQAAPCSQLALAFADT